jgi:fluoride ion exporter CrcB/FEX
MNILDKLTSRNFLTIATGTTFLGVVYYLITENPTLLENPIVTGILGAFTTLTALVYQFYFRVSGPESA